MMKTYKILLSFFLILISGLGFSQSVPTYVPTNGLVGWWGFNGNAQDGSGNGNHGTVNGATLTADRFGNQNSAYSFDGNDDFIQTNFLGTYVNGFAVSVWINSAFNFSNYEHKGIVYSRTNMSRGLGLIMQDTFQSSGLDFTLTFNQNGSLSYGTSLRILPNDGNWHLIVGTFMQSNNQQIYSLFMDGVQISTNSHLNSNPFVLQTPFLFGRDDLNGFGNRNWNGKLDDIGIWNRALTPQEITNLYNSQVSQPCTTSVTTNHNINGCGFAILTNGDTVTQSGNYLDTLSSSGGCDSILNQTVTIQPTSFCNPVPTYVPTNGLVGWWGFNGNAQDGSGNGNHGTVNGATLTTDRFGNQNRAYDFDGMNDFIVVSSLNNFQYKPVTYHLWIRPDSLNHIAYALGGGVVLVGRDWAGNYDQGALMIYDHPAFGINNEVLYYVGQSGLRTGYTPQVSSWISVSMTITSNDSISIYINGNLVTKQFFPTNSNVVAPFKFGAGTEPNQQNSRFLFNGKLDDIGIWNRALTQQEITNLYNSQLPTQTSLCLPTITTTSPSSVGVDTVVIGGDISNDGGSSIVLRGVCYSTSPNPNMGNQRTEDGSGTGSFNTVLRGLASSTTYYARSYAKNFNGVVVYGNEVSFTTSASLPGLRCPGTPTVTDIDGNIYNTVQIGNQCWTQSNLMVSKYRNGDSIPTGLSNSQWSSTSAGTYSIYNNDPVNDGLYGKLYNHYAVTDSRGLCPTGWHVPSDVEWNSMAIFLDSTADTTYSTCGFCTQSNLAGGALKDNMANNPGSWATPNGGATNISGFTGLPGGYRGSSGVYSDIGGRGWWYTSSNYSSSLAYGRSLYYFDATLSRGHGYLSYGVSVRCLKNTLPQVNTTSVTNVTSSTALVTGEVISEGGDQNTIRGFCYSTISNPTISNDTTVNGTGLGVYTGTLQNLAPSTTYYARAYATNSVGTSYGSELSFSTNTSNGFSSCGAVSDIDGNHYQTVLIGSQCWTQSNLRTSRYINGDSVVTGLSDSSWSTTNQGAFIISQYPSDFGFYYNHYAAIDSRGICPSGWRLPSENDWNLLIKTVDNLADTGCINWCEQSTWGAMSLKSSISYPHSPIGWSLAYVGGPGSNSSGFTSLPAGVISTMGHFIIPSSNRWTNYWSTSIHNSPNVPTRMMERDTYKIFKALENQKYGFSIRCIKN